MSREEPVSKVDYTYKTPEVEIVELLLPIFFTALYLHRMAKENNIVLEQERRIKELQDELYTTRQELVDVLKRTNAVMEKSTAAMQGEKIANPAHNYNSPDFDNILNTQMNEATIVKGIMSQVYHGRIVTVQLMGSGTIEIKQQSHHLVMAQTKEKPYTPTRVILSQETFFLMLEAMRFAEDKFELDRKAVIERLTGGGAFNFKEAITLL